MDLWNPKTGSWAENRIKVSSISLIVIFTFLVSCSPRVSNKVLTFFFDGVPSLDSANREEPQMNLVYTDTTRIFREVPFETGTGYTYHYPYQEKECYSCHDEQSKSELIIRLPDLCYICHTDFSQEYNFVHGPVAGGYCTSCHNPHMSKEEKLLIRKGQNICTECHNGKDLLNNQTHSDIGDTECTLCHNPHGGGNNFYLN